MGVPHLKVWARRESVPLALHHASAGVARLAANIRILCLRRMAHSRAWTRAAAMLPQASPSPHDPMPRGGRYSRLDPVNVRPVAPSCSMLKVASPF